MKHTKEEITNALKIIKEECNGSDCCNCPFGDTYGTCMLALKGNPENWKIVDPEPKIWRAFK